MTPQKLIGALERLSGCHTTPGAGPGSSQGPKGCAYTGTVVESSRQTGADLAKSVDGRSLEAAERGQWYRARALSAHLTAARGRQAWLASVAVFVVAALAVAEYPTWRVLALAATFAVTLGFYQWQLRADAQSIASAPRRQWTNDIRCMMPRIVFLLLADAFTG